MGNENVQEVAGINGDSMLLEAHKALRGAQR